MTYIDVQPEPVAGAARATAATEPTWRSWASSAQSALRDAASGARESVVTSAFEEFLADSQPLIQGQAVRAEALGVNLGRALDVLLSSDEQGAAALRQAGEAGEQLGPQLSRPINTG